MRWNLRLWMVVSFGLGISLVLAGLHFADSLRPSQQGAIPGVIGTGCALCALAAVAWLLRRRLGALLAAEEDASREAPAIYRRRPYLTLFAVSFVALFLEVMLIRYCGSQIRILAYYRNVALVSCFLGLGLGCCLGSGRPRHALSFLLWLLPLTALLAQGTLLVGSPVASWAAQASSEHILGDEVAQQAAGGELVSQLLMGGFCVLMLVAISLLFALLGRLLGDAFEAVPRLPGYTVNILGSLAGILGFVALSYLQTPPWVWALVGLVPLIWWSSGRPWALAGAALVAINSAVLMPSYGETVWSPYQKLVGHRLAPGPEGSGTASPAYLVQISEVFYQVAVDLRPQSWRPLGRNPFPHYDAAYEAIPDPDRVLIVGSGTGNDVAAALRAGAGHVDAVDIDPAIVAMGRLHHPEAPYDDDRVTVIVDDARSAFRYLPPASYDLVVFGLLDSHTQLGISSVRLDNYVFTLESFRSARRLLKPDGHFVVTAATFQRWLSERLAGLLHAATGSPVTVSSFGPWSTLVCPVAGSSSPPAEIEAEGPLPTDDWPFLYLPKRSIPRAYVIVIGMLAVASVVLLRAGGLDLGRFSAYHGHLFFLGAAFLLMEVYAINRLALLFGSTWLVSAVTIGLVLTLIVAGNLTVLAAGRMPYRLAYAALILSLLVSYFLAPAGVVGKGLVLSLGYGLLLLSPIYFAALVFARSFRTARGAGSAIGVNILGSVLGGWVEYSTLAAGIRSMALLALVFYLISLLALLRSSPQGEEPASHG